MSDNRSAKGFCIWAVLSFFLFFFRDCLVFALEYEPPGHFEIENECKALRHLKSCFWMWTDWAFSFPVFFSSPKCPNYRRCESVMNRFKVKWLCVVPPGVTSWRCAAKQGRSCWSGFSSSLATGSTSPAVSNSSASPYRLERERVFCGLSVSVCLRLIKKSYFRFLLYAHILQSCTMELT